jgi:Cu(I)/Ag(I) efflux system membrane fusion protein
MKHLKILFLLAAAGCSRPAGEEAHPVKFYQSPMHPWITSDEPGQCTICGMDLVAVHEGEAGFAATPGTVTLMAETEHILGVTVSPVTRGALEKTIRVAGTIEDDDSRHTVVSAFFDGRIDRVFVEHVGIDVRREQPLAQIYSPELLYVVREFQTASKRGDRDPQAAVARQRLVQFGLTPRQVEELASASREEFLLNLRSPTDGTVVVRDVYPGKYVKTGEVLFEIADFSTMWFHADVYEQDLPWVRVGDAAKVTTPAAPGREFEGKITLVDPTFDETTRSTRLRIEVPNPSEKHSGALARPLPHRGYGEATITAAIDDVLVVPRSAVLDTGSRAAAYVQKEGGAYERREVTVGRRGDTMVEILSGLTPGEKVVTRGNLLIDAEAQMAQPGSLGVPAQKTADGANPVSVETLARWTVLSDAAAALAADDLAAFNGTGLAQSDSLEMARLALHQSLAPELDKALLHPEAVKVYECPMSSEAFPGAPPTARWIQLGAPLRNPWFGPAMLDCGREVKP